MNKKQISVLVALSLILGAVVVARLQLKKNKGSDLKVGYLPVTCHLTCPVTDYTTKTSKGNRFISQRFSDFPSAAEAFKAGHLQASFFIAPLAMKLVEQGVPAKIVYLGHRDGSTIMVRSDLPAQDLAELKGMRMAIPSRYSNQYLLLIRLLEKKGMSKEDLQFVEIPPPEMPAALANKNIDAYFVGEPHAAKAELAGTGRVLHHVKDIWPRFISCVLVVSTKLIAENPELVQDLVRGISASGEWAETHRLEAAAVVAPYYRQDEKLLRHVLTTPLNRVSYKGLIPSQSEIEEIYQAGKKAGILDRNLPVNAYLDLQFAQNLKLGSEL